MTPFPKCTDKLMSVGLNREQGDGTETWRGFLSVNLSLQEGA